MISDFSQILCTLDIFFPPPPQKHQIFFFFFFFFPPSVMEYSSKSNDQRFVCSVPLFVRHILCSVGLSFSVMFVPRSVHRSSVRRSLSLSLSLPSLFARRCTAAISLERRERPQRCFMDAKIVLLFSPDVIDGARACPFVHACCDWKPNKLLAWRIDQARRRRRRGRTTTRTTRTRWGGVGLELYCSFRAESAAAALL